MTRFEGGGGGLPWQITDWNFNWISSNTYKNPMIGIKGLEEGKNGITLIEGKVVIRHSICVKTLYILPGLVGILSFA